MEDQRNQFCARGGIYVRATLVLVSTVPNSDIEWHHGCLPPGGGDAIAGSHRRTECVFRDRSGVAAIRNYAPGISASELGREAAFRKRILRCRARGFPAHRPDREIRCANAWCTIAVRVQGPG